ncbi:TonB-dependent receptor domain-containing protein [Spiribacter halobius]|uniref:TonB-dependent vitamin B12 receptor n=1 Tax=Sediminicurvatus halobius TaxID=2182432 RepID=A0A2U2N253_9GAMM|nr:TonB-dependent receptor [Spiribacter halobius]PWG63147.1 TonB-dependent vitamin B12 receptor [Spiribacter halobius]UEX77596.1 TonB-dependent receptor [Spiribacter halobius]
MTIRRLLAGAALAACPLLASAAETTEPLLVTPNRNPFTADETLASVSVITREDIERRQPQDLPDLLAELPGVHIARNGGRGQSTSLFLRGTNSDQTLVLIDGVRVASATAGSAALESIPLARIERIEVVRGPRSTLYGADAVGGVVQIFTRANDTHVTLGAGSRDSRSLSAGIGREFENGRLSLSAGGFSTDGFDVQEAAGSDTDDDGYEERNVSLRGEYAPSSRLTLRGSLLRNDSEVEFDASPTLGGPDETENVNQALSVAADYRVTDRWDMTLALGRARDDSDSRAADGDRFTTDRDQASLQTTARYRDVITTFGVDWYRDEVTSNLDFEESRRDNLGVFAQQQWFLGRWDLQAGLRHDDNEAFGETTTGSAAVGYAFTESVRGFVSAGSAFRAPTFNDLYYPNVGFFSGNPDLDPERSRSAEAGLEGEAGGFGWGLAAFHTEVDDLIQYDSTTFRNENVSEARIRGAELTLEFARPAWRAEAALTLQDPENRDTGERLNRRPQRLASLRVERDLGPWALDADLRYVGPRPDGDERLGGYAVAGFGAGYRFAPDWRLRLSVDNAFDREYQSVAGFETAGRTGFVTLTWEPAAQ